MTMQVLMLRNRMVDGVLLASGSTYTVADDDGAYLVANEWATRTDGVPDRVITSDVSVPTIDPATGALLDPITGQEIDTGDSMIRFGETLVADVIGGEHYSFAISAVGKYRVDAEMDILAKTSDASASYGMALLNDASSYKRTGSLATMTGLDFGTSNFSLEFWCTSEGDTANQARVFSVGVSGNAELQAVLDTIGSGQLQVACRVVDNAANTLNAVTVISPTGFVNYTGLLHYVITVDRGASLGTATITYYLNGTQVGVQNWTEAASPGSLNFSSITSGSAVIYAGGNVGSTIAYKGRIEDIKLYTKKLELSEIVARNNRGPVRTLGLDAKDANLSWWMSMQGGTATCETGYGNATLNAQGAAAITQRTGGAAASDADSLRILANEPVTAYIDKAYLNVLNLSAATGTIRVTRLA